VTTNILFGSSLCCSIKMDGPDRRKRGQGGGWALAREMRGRVEPG